MRRRRLWCVVLISGLGALFFTTAKPVNERAMNASRWEHVNRTCRSRECNDTANYKQLRSIESYMNTSADPCQSFFNYSCGNWHNSNPHDKTAMVKGYVQLIARYVDFFEGWLHQRELVEQAGVLELKDRRSLAERNELPETKHLAEIREILNDDASHENFEQNELKGSYKSEENSSDWHALDDPVLQKLLKYYRSCKAQNNTRQQNLRAYYETSKLSVDWLLNSYDWLDTLASIGRFGYAEHFLNMRVVLKNISVHAIVIAPHATESPLNISSEMYDVLSDFTNHTKETLQQRFDSIESDLRKLNCQYCEYVHDEGDDIGECDCYKHVQMTFGNLTTQLPGVDWQRFLSPQLGRHLEDNDILEVANMDLIRFQLVYVQEMNTELNLVYTLARFLNYIQEQRHHFVEHETIEISCIHHMQKVMNMPMNYLYERNYYSSKRAENQRIIEEVFEELKQQFERMIRQNKMELSNFIQRKLETKLKHTRINVGNLPKNVSLQFYYDYIGAYNYSEDFIYNHLHALEVFYKHVNTLMDAAEYDIEHTWHTFELHFPSFYDSMNMSPYYSARINLIAIPFAYLQLPYYDSSFWPAFIYGDLAATLGHELIHAFDTEFLEYDENGNPNPQPLTNMFLNQNFRKNVVCLQHGTTFERERMADVSGIRLALNTFLSIDPNAMEHNGELYFLQFAQFFCSAINQGDSTHDSENLRLDYVLATVPEFGSIFNCPLDSPMNPTNKCEMYT